MMRKTFLCLVCLGLLLALGGLLLAQTATTGQIVGTVNDPTGAVIPNAKVTLTSPTGQVRDTTTDTEGRYRFVLLPPGTYKVAVQAASFRSFVLDNIVVKITETTQADAALTVSAQTESVSVSAQTPLVQTTSASAGRVIESAQITQLPLPTRNFQQILTLSPGTVANLSNNTEMGRGDANIDVNGQRSTSNDVLVDGQEVISPGTNSTPNISVPAPDALQEFIVQTSMYDATTGRNAGGNIAVVTKSGTNAVHGSAYEFLRNEKLNANDFFLNRAGRARPVLKRNQFGGTFGGPIVKDKTFFFLSYQGTRERNGASLTNSLSFPFIPAGLTDDRSDAALTALTAAYNPPAPGLPLVLSPVAKAILQAKLPDGQWAIPSAAGTAASPIIPVSTPMSGVSRFREDQFNVNIDQNLGAKNKLSGKFFFSDTPQYQSTFSFVGANPQQIPGYGGFIDFHNRLFTLADTHIISPELINQARIGFSRINGPSHPEEPFVGSPTAPVFGINNPLCTAGDARFCGLPTIQVLGLFSIGSTSLADQKSTTNTFTYSDMLTWTRGRHFLRWGADLTHYQVNFFFNFFSRGQINFNSFADFLQGKPAFGLLGNGVRDRGMRSTDVDMFLQDDFRATDRLTLNLGARLSRLGGISEVKGRLSNFDPAQFAKNTLPCTVAAPCRPPNGLFTVPDTLNPNDWNIAPRFGFAYKVGSKNNLVLRGGTGVYFDRFSTRVANLQIFNYPFDINGLSFGTAGLGFANPFPNLAGLTFPISPAVVPSPVPFYFNGVPFPLLGQTPISGIYVDKNFRTPYVYQYNLGFQYEPLRNWLIEIGYVGSKGTKLIDVYTLNQGTSAATAPYTASGFSNNKALNGFQMAESEANSHYDSLQASLTKRLSHGLQFLLGYTWSKSIDDTSGAPTNEFAAVPGDQQNLASNRGLSDFDRRHRIVLSLVEDLPTLYRGDLGIAKRLMNEWQVGTIITAQSGLPGSVICASGSALLNRADRIRNNPISLPGSAKDKLDNYFNQAAFVMSCQNVAPFGTSGRNILRGPNQRNVDLSIVKFIPLNERQKLEFRTEFFNVFNMVNFAPPAVNVLVPQTLGKITGTSTGPRVIQFALKYNF